MNQIKYVSLILIFALAMGCSGTNGNFTGTYGNFKRQSESESKVTNRELIDNWSDYDIWLHYHSGLRLTIIVFDTKNDDKKILFRSSWPKVKDQEMWTEIVKANTTSDGEFVLRWASRQDFRYTGVQEIWGPDNQLYGYTIYQENSVALERVKFFDNNTILLTWGPPPPVGGR